MHYQLGELKKVEKKYKATKGVEQLSERLGKIHNEKMWTMISDQETVRREGGREGGREEAREGGREGIESLFIIY